MRLLRTCLVVIVVLVAVQTVFGAKCRICLQYMEEGKKMCDDCSVRFDRQQTDARQEKAIVDHIVAARDEYERYLDELIVFYKTQGDFVRMQKAQEERSKLRTVPKYDYVVVADLVGNISPTEPIREADDLYRTGMDYKNYPDLFTKRERLERAIGKFTAVIETYPNSDKADDSAYRLGEIYAGFYYKDPHTAVEYFEKCFQWNPETQYPVRYKAAKLYDEKIEDFEKAARLYKLSANLGPLQKYREDSLERYHELAAEGYGRE